MKNHKYFVLAAVFLSLCLGVSDGFAQKRTNKKTQVGNLKSTLDFIVGNMKSQVMYTDDKENAVCPNQTLRNLVYEETLFSDTNLSMKIKDDLTRSVCSANLMNNDRTTSKSVSNDELQVSIPLKQLDSTTIRTEACPLEAGYKRKEGGCFVVNLETFANAKAIKIDKINSFKFDEKQINDRQQVSYTTNQFQIYFSDEETANKMAGIFAQAIKLAGGK